MKRIVEEFQNFKTSTHKLSCVLILFIVLFPVCYKILKPFHFIIIPMHFHVPKCYHKKTTIDDGIGNISAETILP